MPPIDIIVPQSGARNWQMIVIERLRAEGYDIAVLHWPQPADWPAAVSAVLALERRIFRRTGPGLAAPIAEIRASSRSRSAVLRLDLAGDVAPSDIPTIALVFDGSRCDLSAAVAVAAGNLPVIEAVLDHNVVVGRAWPMIDKRESAALGIEDVLARAITLAVSVVRAFAEGRLAGNERVLETTGSGNGTAIRFASAYLTKALPRLGREAIRRTRFRQAHWRVGYRFTHGPGVAETGRLGEGWSVLPDLGDRFYADPFAFEWQGRSFVFVEDYPHATGKAVISVVPFDVNGVPQEARVVLEGPHHLSYPQVFERDGAIWMLPEASSGGKLTLYRATAFPDRWTAKAVLIEGEISDATLLEHEGLLWLFATHRDGYGSTSDTLVVFNATALTGPWIPHPLNPILIDRRSARPGGAFVRSPEGRIFLPVQDGTLGYGGGLGFSEVLALDRQTVRLSAPRPIAADGDWPYPKIHTLNRSGRLEVIDGIAAVRKRSGRQ
ncbi:glucosamine inositolphosphorylceramide transferase family protein [Neorhizobium sp. DT-125]|uniref:glucosamine inositolphosphorylceramide transferase family protein n=1 Tax=Neorhizobium sp. DT-125 TaxID=3396163 RepID=UPI003F1D8F63